MEARKQIDMTGPQYWTTVTVVFGMGIFVGWALFGDPGMFPVMAKAASLGEWLAGVGTWVIGYGAWKYAREGHLHRIAEADMLRTRERQEKCNQLRLIMLKASKAAWPGVLIDSFQKKATNDIKTELFEVAVEKMYDDAVSLVWNDHEKKYFTTEMALAFPKLEISVSQLGVRAKLALTQLRKRGESGPFSKASEIWFTNLVRLAADATTASEEFIAVIQAEIIKEEQKG